MVSSYKQYSFRRFLFAQIRKSICLFSFNGARNENDRMSNEEAWDALYIIELLKENLGQMNEEDGWVDNTA